MATIRVLSAHLVNKIAAGEVIERPASVVKELVENALDAGATRVDVAIEKGGKQLIAVTDNGKGMAQEDLELAFVPHATSKLGEEEDLFRIRTMGFRGEALASIASISHAHIRTRRPEDTAGYAVEASGETVGPVRPAAGAAGTTVTIRDLFFNTPARRKFMRADATEVGHVSEALARIALAHPEVAFGLTHNGRSVHDLPAVATLAQRARDLLGPEIAEDLIELPARDGELAVRGLIGTPAAARASAKWQYVFLNGRYIRDRNLMHALREGYRGLVDPSRYPVAVLLLTIDPEAVDVNVHPTKVEVRFRDPVLVHSHVLSAIRETLRAADLRPGADLPVAEALGSDTMPDDPKRQGLREALAEFFKSQPPAQGTLHFPHTHDRPEHRAARRLEDDPRPLAEPPTEPWSAPAEHHAFRPPMPATPDRPREVEPADDAPPPPVGVPETLQVHNAYIIASDEHGLVIIDQHALHERILYERLAARLAQGPLESQQLLLPATLKVTPSQRAVLAENAELLGRLGIEVGDFGPGTVAIQRFPTLLDRLDPADFLADALDKLAEDDPGLGQERLLEGLMAMVSCKAAVKAGDPLTPEEIASLLEQRRQVARASACPHGRPTEIRLTLRDLERQFKRT